MIPWSPEDWYNPNLRGNLATGGPHITQFMTWSVVALFTEACKILHHFPLASLKEWLPFAFFNEFLVKPKTLSRKHL